MTTQQRYSLPSYQQECSVPGCTDRIRVIKKRLCITHYHRLRDTGSVNICPVDKKCDWCGRGMRLRGSAAIIKKYCSKACQGAAARRRQYTTPGHAEWRSNYKYHWRLKQYGMTDEDYSKLLSAQDNSCGICKRKAADVVLGLCVDHDHATKKVRGLLCRKCNAALGGFGDSIELLNAASAYLLRVESGV